MESSSRKSGSGSWLMTYSDLVTLLLTFFVLLYSLTPGIDESTFNDFIAFFQASTGILKQNAINEQQTDESTLAEQWQEIREYLEEHGLESEVSIQTTPRGVKVTLSDSLTFNSGSADLLDRAREVLGKMAGIFDKEVRSITVEGHTDDVPIAASSPFRSNWHLGAARAVSVVLFLNGRSVLRPDKFEASSFGEYRPIATNDTKEGRSKNRRVELYVRYKEGHSSELEDLQYALPDSGLTKNIN